MMRFIRYETGDGRIVGSIMVGTLGEAVNSLFTGTDAVIEGTADSAFSYVANDEVCARPDTGLPANHTIPTNTDWAIPDVPAGTEVEIDGVVQGVTDDTGLTITFDAPGVWPVTLRPPFPWVEASCEVTVT
jgi:hypothetical protein